MSCAGTSHWLVRSTSASNSSIPSSSGTSSPDPTVQFHTSTSRSKSSEPLERARDPLRGNAAPCGLERWRGLLGAEDEKLWSRDRVPVLSEKASVKSDGAEMTEDPLGLGGTDDGVGKIYIDSSSCRSPSGRLGLSTSASTAEVR